MTEQVTIFGANGNVGSQIVNEMIQRGYHVVAFVHSHSDLKETSQLKIFQGDIYNSADVDDALQGSDIVISALSSWGTPKKDILTVAMSHIIASMMRQGISRIISLTGAEARASGDHLGVVHRLMHLILRVVASKVLVDGERHIAQLEKSQLDWTVIRSPVMSSKIPSDVTTYHLTMKRPMPWRTISRHLVVISMIDAIHDRTWMHKAPYVS